MDDDPLEICAPAWDGNRVECATAQGLIVAVVVMDERHPEGRCPAGRHGREELAAFSIPGVFLTQHQQRRLLVPHGCRLLDT